MARLNVNPTRMEMARLRNKLRVAVKGHKLLKDKSDEMTRQFSALIKQNRELRSGVETQLMNALGNFLCAQVTMTNRAISAALITDYNPKVTASTENIMGLSVPKLELTNKTAVQQNHQNRNLQQSLLSLHALLPELIKLATVEKACELLAADIEKNRRRINALEHIMIPDTRETIKYIQMKLGENERQNIARIMKLELKKTKKD